MIVKYKFQDALRGDLVRALRTEWKRITGATDDGAFTMVDDGTALRIKGLTQDWTDQMYAVIEKHVIITDVSTSPEPGEGRKLGS